MMKCIYLFIALLHHFVRPDDLDREMIKNLIDLSEQRDQFYFNITVFHLPNTSMQHHCHCKKPFAQELLELLKTIQTKGSNQNHSTPIIVKKLKNNIKVLLKSESKGEDICQMDQVVITRESAHKGIYNERILTKYKKCVQSWNEICFKGFASNH